jgi:hypothetical protein
LPAVYLIPFSNQFTEDLSTNAIRMNGSDEKETQEPNTYPNDIEEYHPDDGHHLSSDANTAVDSESLSRKGGFGEATANAVDVNGKFETSELNLG